MRYVALLRGTRSREELAAVIRRNPFVKRGANEDELHVVFLADEPRKRTALDPQRSPGDEFVVDGREIFPCGCRTASAGRGSRTRTSTRRSGRRRRCATGAACRSSSSSAADAR